MAGTGGRAGDAALLDGARVVVTRTPERALALARLLRREGAEVTAAPLLEATLPARTAPLAQLLDRAARAGHGDWLAVTSVNTVRALQALAGEDLDGRLAGARRAGLRVAAVGDATASALAAAGLAPDLVPAGAHSADGLLAEWPEEPAPGLALLPQSARARPVLADGLAARGYRVRAVTAYETVPWPAAAPLAPGAAQDGPDAPGVLDRGQLLARLSGPGVDAVVLTAPSHLDELVGEDPSVLAGPALVAIGEPTRRAAAAHGLHAVAAGRPTPEGVRDALVRALAARRGAPPGRSAPPGSPPGTDPIRPTQETTP
ncbi:hypothetical protein AUQ48_09420 [Kocuria flava]|uniref:Uroporphyrinogen-III synthase n=1 Tax=Kocuria flava TaxID=446860 RepID=A0A2N4T2K9_9MICC|nr:uroporphyrinogen-III synthase [Kocuria flava]PLC12416.1 hypothetical protein AUQ48_09420 [Kocuria flava]